MRKFKFLLLSSAAAVFFNSCNNGTAEENGDAEINEEQVESIDDEITQHEDVGETSSAENSQSQAGTIELDRGAAKVITDQYLEIKNALVASDAAAAKTAATNMLRSLKNSEGELTIEMSQHAEQISTTEDLSAQRKHFLKLSQSMYSLAKNFELGRDLYWQYCPMAFDGEGGNWVSQSKEIRNPYYGDKMLKCGRVQETL